MLAATFAFAALAATAADGFSGGPSAPRPAPNPRGRLPSACGVVANAAALADQPGFGLARQYVGLTLMEVRAAARRTGRVVRVVGSDGRCNVVTADARKDRVSVYLVDGLVDAAAVY